MLSFDIFTETNKKIVNVVGHYSHKNKKRYQNPKNPWYGTDYTSCSWCILGMSFKRKEMQYWNTISSKVLSAEDAKLVTSSQWLGLGCRNSGWATTSAFQSLLFKPWTLELTLILIIQYISEMLLHHHLYHDKEQKLEEYQFLISVCCILHDSINECT